MSSSVARGTVNQKNGMIWVNSRKVESLGKLDIYG